MKTEDPMIPDLIRQMGDKVLSKTTQENDLLATIKRLEMIESYIGVVLETYKNRKKTLKKTRSF